ncbi:MAG: hypothetical protein AB1758_33500, partial [Candidatus Eremiobacterota bacterium]
WVDYVYELTRSVASMKDREIRALPGGSEGGLRPPTDGTGETGVGSKPCPRVSPPDSLRPRRRTEQPVHSRLPPVGSDPTWQSGEPTLKGTSLPDLEHVFGFRS